MTKQITQTPTTTQRPTYKGWRSPADEKARAAAVEAERLAKNWHEAALLARQTHWIDVTVKATEQSWSLVTSIFNSLDELTLGEINAAVVTGDEAGLAAKLDARYEGCENCATAAVEVEAGQCARFRTPTSGRKVTVVLAGEGGGAEIVVSAAERGSRTALGYLIDAARKSGLLSYASNAMHAPYIENSYVVALWAAAELNLAELAAQQRAGDAARRRGEPTKAAGEAYAAGAESRAQRSDQLYARLGVRYS